MTKELNCTSCEGPATLTRTVPLCARCGLAVAEEALGFVFAGVRDGAEVIELPAPPEERMSPAEANDVAYQHLARLRRRGVTTLTYQDCKELKEITQRSRAWVYRWLDARVADQSLTKSKTADGVSYTIAY